MQLSQLRKELKQRNRLAVNQVVEESRVILCTNTGAAEKLLDGRQFDTVVIDEWYLEFIDME